MKYRIHSLKYLTVFSALFFALLSFSSTGFLTFSVVVYAYGFIPFVELFLKADESNLSAAEEELLKDDQFYDWVLYLAVPFQFLLLFYFLYSLQNPLLNTIDVIGRILSMGIICGNAINIGHELGHRVKFHEQIMAKIMLLTSLNMQFFIEHNRGHHKRVATDEDPASAIKNQLVYTFWIKSIVLSFFSAWKLEAKRLKKQNKLILSFNNEMLRFIIIQVVFTLGIYLFFGTLGLIAFLSVALIGHLILETTNYIEHYGLRRKKTERGTYERTLPIHSWNSNHIYGRLMLFELSRHSDHHYKASRKYQILKHHQDAPQMPTGYPGMMLLSLFPPLWFYVMNPLVDRVMND